MSQFLHCSADEDENDDDDGGTGKNHIILETVVMFNSANQKERYAFLRSHSPFLIIMMDE